MDEHELLLVKLKEIKDQMSVVMNKMGGGRVPRDLYEETLKVYRMIEEISN